MRWPRGVGSEDSECSADEVDVLISLMGQANPEK